MSIFLPLYIILQKFNVAIYTLQTNPGPYLCVSSAFYWTFVGHSERSEIFIYKQVLIHTWSKHQTLLGHWHTLGLCNSGGKLHSSHHIQTKNESKPSADTDTLGTTRGKIMQAFWICLIYFKQRWAQQTKQLGSSTTNLLNRNINSVNAKQLK